MGVLWRSFLLMSQPYDLAFCRKRQSLWCHCYLTILSLVPCNQPVKPACFDQCVSTRNDSSFSECMLFRVRKSGSRSSSLVNREVSLGVFFRMTERRARIKVSCSCSTNEAFSIPERSERKEHVKLTKNKTFFFLFNNIKCNINGYTCPVKYAGSSKTRVKIQIWLPSIDLRWFSHC